MLIILGVIACSIFLSVILSAVNERERDRRRALAEVRKQAIDREEARLEREVRLKMYEAMLPKKNECENRKHNRDDGDPCGDPGCK